MNPGLSFSLVEMVDLHGAELLMEEKVILQVPVTTIQQDQPLSAHMHRKLPSSPSQIISSIPPDVNASKHQ